MENKNLNSEMPFDEEDAREMASNGNIAGLLQLRVPSMPEDIIQAAYQNGKPKIRNGYSEKDAANVLLLGFPAQKATEILAEDGYVHGTLFISREHRIFELSELAIKAGYKIAKSRIRNGYSENDAKDFLLLALSTRDAAETLAQDGFMDATVAISLEYKLSEISEAAIESGYSIARDRIRNGVSEKTAATFLLLSRQREKYYQETANDGLLVTAYILKIKCKIDEILPAETIDVLLKKHESEKFSGFSTIVPAFVGRWDMAKGEMPDISAESMFTEIAGANDKFHKRFQNIMQRDDNVMAKKWNERKS